MPIQPIALTTNSSWFAGFFDADGTVTLNMTGTLQITISVTQANLVDIQGFTASFGGSMYYDTAQNGYYKWSVQSKEDVLRMTAYFQQHTRSAKKHRLFLIPEVYRLASLGAHKPASSLHSAWYRLIVQWDAMI